jgi:hypothetical protein
MASSLEILMHVEMISDVTLVCLFALNPCVWRRVKQILAASLSKLPVVFMFYLDGLQSKVIEALLDIKIPSIRQQVRAFRTQCAIILLVSDRLLDK